jgi:hypothetical protein
VFIGHYAPALALKPSAPRVPLWGLFVAVQLLDFGWDALVFAGVEHVRLTPGITASNPLDLYDMPWTHSLLAALLWSAAAAALAWRALDARSAAIVALAVFSHWALDLIVHRPDLSLAGASTPSFGLGLWNYPLPEIALEIGSVIAAGAWAARASKAKRAVWVLTAVLASVAVVERLMPPPASVTQVAASAFVAYVLFALAARRVDRAEQKVA